MKIAWVRGAESLSFNRPHTFFVLGVRGSGKSSLLEHIGERYLERGHAVLYLFGSKDGEGLAWLRSPWVKEKKVLLIHGDNVDVTCPFDTRPVGKISLRDFGNYDILVSASPLYSSPNDEFRQVARLQDLLYKRLSWRRLVYVIVRESSNLYYSRIKLGEDQLSAKASMIYLVREARHMGMALGLDTLKFTAVDSDLRVLIDFLFYKSLGLHGLPRDQWWIYRYFDPNAMQRLRPNEFVVVSRRGSLGCGVFPEIPWHKQEKEDILNRLGIRVEYGEEIDYGTDRRRYRTVSDMEHAKIIEDRATTQEGTMKIGKRFKRSSLTILLHIRKHNKKIEEQGYCDICRRVKSKFAEVKV